MNKLCQCPASGFCSRHQIEKTFRQWLACRGEAPTIDCGRKEWRAWEIGNLGATPPDDPQPDIEWECGSVVMAEVPPFRPSVQRVDVFDETKCQVGKRVKALLKSKGVGERRNCSCNHSAAKMDAMGCDGCEAEFDACVEMLMEGAAERWWLRPLLALFGGEMRDAAEKLLREAIDLERERVTDCEIVLDSSRHGFGDAILFSWVAEGAKQQGLKIAHYAVGTMAELLLSFGQNVVSKAPLGMLNINDAYFKELRSRGTISALRNRCDWLNVKEPVRPQPIEVPQPVNDWVHQVVKYPPVLLFPQSTRELRVWPENYWAILLDGIRERGLQPLLCVWGPGSGEKWRKYVPDALVDLTWMQIVGLVLKGRVKAAFGNNSGPVHVTGTLDVPTFVLSGLTTKESLSGIPSMHHVSVSKEECPCVGCYYATPPKQPSCDLGCIALQMLTPQKVLEIFDTYEIS